MRFLPFAFWITAILFTGLAASLAINLQIAEFYHPVSTKYGDALRPLRWLGVAIPPILIVVFLALRFVRGPLSMREMFIGIGMLGLATALTYVPRVDTNEGPTYYLGDTAYLIPWRYDARNGEADPGGTFFVINVAAEGFLPRYEAPSSRHIKLSFALAGSEPLGHTSQRQGCKVEHGSFSCQWLQDGLAYGAWGSETEMPADEADFLRRMVALLGSFAAGPK